MDTYCPRMSVHAVVALDQSVPSLNECCISVPTFIAARCKGVEPALQLMSPRLSLLVAITKRPPWLTRSLRQSPDPLQAAKCTGVRPALLRALTILQRQGSEASPVCMSMERCGFEHSL